MIPQRIIEKAIEGGWNAYFGRQGELLITRDTSNSSAGTWTPQWQEIVLDIFFWKALGKVEFNDPNVKTLEDPIHRAHRFYDLILTGGDTEKFWEELLPK